MYKAESEEEEDTSSEIAPTRTGNISSSSNKKINVNVNDIVNHNYAKPRSKLQIADGETVYYTEILPNDVLLGRGTGPNEFDGNIRFRAMISQAMFSVPPGDFASSKAILAREVVDNVGRSGGLFLRKVKEEDIPLQVQQELQKRTESDEKQKAVPSSSVHKFPVTAKKMRPQEPTAGIALYVEVDHHVAIEKAKQSFRHQTRSGTVNDACLLSKSRNIADKLAVSRAKQGSPAGQQQNQPKKRKLVETYLMDRQQGLQASTLNPVLPSSIVSRVLAGPSLSSWSIQQLLRDQPNALSNLGSFQNYLSPPASLQAVDRQPSGSQKFPDLVLDALLRQRQQLEQEGNRQQLIRTIMAINTSSASSSACGSDNGFGTATGPGTTSNLPFNHSSRLNVDFATALMNRLPHSALLNRQLLTNNNTAYQAFDSLQTPTVASLLGTATSSISSIVAPSSVSTAIQPSTKLKINVKDNKSKNGKKKEGSNEDSKKKKK